MGRSVFVEGQILPLSQGATPQCLPKFLEPPTMHSLGMTNSRKIFGMCIKAAEID